MFTELSTGMAAAGAVVFERPPVAATVSRVQVLDEHAEGGSMTHAEYMQRWRHERRWMAGFWSVYYGQVWRRGVATVRVAR